MDGILNINKPWGRTSFSVVALVRRLTGERRVGHGGTLDPAATGVLPVCLGQGTRVAPYLAEATKHYRAQIELGVATDTHDVCGRITNREDPSDVDREQVLSALASFQGEIWQTPPMYSAVKHRGRRLYELARCGVEVERRSRRAVIHGIELTDWQPPVATVEVVCGKGTYIRSLARDLGHVLGCGAILNSLIRLRCGSFDAESAVSLPQFEDSVRYGYWWHLVYPIDTVLTRWAAAVVSEGTAAMIRNGHAVTLPHNVSPRPDGGEDRCRVYTDSGSFVGLMRFERETGLWHPARVFMQSVRTLME